MIEVCVRHHDRGDPARTCAGQEWSHHPPARVMALIPRPRVDQNPVTTGRSNGGRITLPYIQKM